MFHSNIKFLILVILAMALFSCKSEPEKKEEEKTEKATTKKEEEKGKTTETKRKISEEQFAEAQELIDRAKKAQADIYDKENYNNSIENLEKSKEFNDSNVEEAYEAFDLSRKQAQEAYYNAYKERAILKKAEADTLIEELEILSADKKATMYDNAILLYNEGEESFSEENYKLSFDKFSESVDSLKAMLNESEKARNEQKLKIDYVKSLIDKAENLGALQYAKDDFNSAKFNLEEGIILFSENELEKSGLKLSDAEKFALAAIDKTNAALLEEKRLKALKAIMEAGKKVEDASKKPIINEKGEAEKGVDYKFEFDENEEDSDLNNSPNSNLSYKDVLAKAIDYIEKAKAAYKNKDYDMALKYANIAKKIASSYSAAGIKTKYVVRLIPEKRDCLWRISEYDFIYGNPFYWPMIWKTNKKSILNPDLIYPGQIFLIPQLD